MELAQGQIVFKSSRLVTVLVNGERWSCELRGILRRERGTAVVVGDLVEVSPDGPGRGRVERVLPRRNWLSRKRKVGGGRELILASNLDQVLGVFATRKPRLKFGTIDRLLIAAGRQGLPAAIVLNKMDLSLDAEAEQRLQVYEAMGYALLKVSAETGAGFDALESLLGGRVSVMAGPSGVGKSSLLRPIFPDLNIRIGEVSHYNEKGRHITTAATWYPLPGGGAVVDTPGFREYALWGLEPGELARWMPDLAALGGKCRFVDCLHRQEPDCAVRAGLEEGIVSHFRYRSYIGILESLLDS